MARELITSWNDYQAAIDRLLAMACQKICIYDEDLSQLRLDSASRLQHLQRILRTATNGQCLMIAVRNAEPLRQKNPLLMALLGSHNHRFAMQQTPPQLAHLRDAMIIVDDKHGLIRFERDQPRSKLLIDESIELNPYRARFQEIWNEGGEAISNTVLGL